MRNNYLEKDLYKPIKDYFEKIISKDFDIEIEVFETHKTIPKNILDLYPRLNDVNTIYSYKPDLIFIFKKENKIGIIEVKDDPLKMVDVYQAKRYSEIIQADFSFLISPYDFSRDDQNIMKNEETSYISNYYINKNDEISLRQINIGILSLDKNNMNIDDIRFYSTIKL